MKKIKKMNIIKELKNGGRSKSKEKLLTANIL